MTDNEKKVSTAIACRVARIDRDQFNEAVTTGVFGCAPLTTRGRTRYFGDDDLLALYLYRDLIEDGFKRETAGLIACDVAAAARAAPEAKAISYVFDYFSPRSGQSFPAEQVPPHDQWDDVNFSGTDIKRVLTFRIGKTRAMIAHYKADELSHVGPED